MPWQAKWSALSARNVKGDSESSPYCQTIARAPRCSRGPWPLPPGAGASSARTARTDTATAVAIRISISASQPSLRRGVTTETARHASAQVAMPAATSSGCVRLLEPSGNAPRPANSTAARPISTTGANSNPLTRFRTATRHKSPTARRTAARVPRHSLGATATSRTPTSSTRRWAGVGSAAGASRATSRRWTGSDRAPANSAASSPAAATPRAADCLTVRERDKLGLSLDIAHATDKPPT